MTLFGTERLFRRLLPLAALLKLTMLFPDRAPSRVGVAMRAGSTRDLERRFRQGVSREPARAAAEILSLATALSNHDRATRGHSERVRIFTEMIAQEMHLSDDARNRLRWAALLHDVGKLAIHSGILTKSGTLTEEEWAAIHRHPLEGARLIAPLAPWLGEWALVIEQHHERYDGDGYPFGLAAEEISLDARIVCVADAFEVMTAVRTYKDAMSPQAARAELARCAGSHFDPAIVRAFLGISLKRLNWQIGLGTWLAEAPLAQWAANLGKVAFTSAHVAFAAAAVLTSAVMAAPAAASAAARPGTRGVSSAQAREGLRQARAMFAASLRDVLGHRAAIRARAEVVVLGPAPDRALPRLHAGPDLLAVAPAHARGVASSTTVNRGAPSAATAGSMARYVAVSDSVVTARAASGVPHGAETAGGATSRGHSGAAFASANPTEAVREASERAPTSPGAAGKPRGATAAAAPAGARGAGVAHRARRGDRKRSGRSDEIPRSASGPDTPLAAGPAGRAGSVQPARGHRPPPPVQGSLGGANSNSGSVREAPQRGASSPASEHHDHGGAAGTGRGRATPHRPPPLQAMAPRPGTARRIEPAEPSQPARMARLRRWHQRMRRPVRRAQRRAMVPLGQHRLQWGTPQATADARTSRPTRRARWASDIVQPTAPVRPSRSRWGLRRRGGLGRRQTAQPRPVR